MKLKLAVTLTDFSAPYLAQLHAAVLARCPRARLLALDDSLPPGDIRRAAFMLAASREFFPKGAVFLCVVDPGVGTQRGLLCARGGGQYFLAPDNGLLEPLRRASGFDEIREIDSGKLFPRASATFHGRDILAPLCADLLNGKKPASFGPQAGRIVPLNLPWPRFKGSAFDGEIVFADGFGNCITNIPAVDVHGVYAVFRGRRIKSVASYGFAATGAACLIAGSSGFFELAVNRGSFFAKYGVRAGDKVRIVHGNY
jgi:hypothetical protein